MWLIKNILILVVDVDLLYFLYVQHCNFGILGPDEKIWGTIGHGASFAGKLDLGDLIVIILHIFQTKNFHQVIETERNYDLELLYPRYLTYRGKMRTQTENIVDIPDIY